MTMIDYYIRQQNNLPVESRARGEEGISLLEHNADQFRGRKEFVVKVGVSE